MTKFTLMAEEARKIEVKERQYFLVSLLLVAVLMLAMGALT